MNFYANNFTDEAALKFLKQGEINYIYWGKEEQAQFMARHKPWPKHKSLFAQKYYADIALEVGKWLDDREIFIFCYLVRNFWRKVVREEMREDEIWIASLFELVLNVVKPTQPDLTEL